MTNLFGRNIISFDDLSIDDVLSIFETADEINADPKNFGIFGFSLGGLMASMVFNLNDNNTNRRDNSFHGGLPPIVGEKWMCNKWIRLKPIK